MLRLNVASWGVSSVLSRNIIITPKGVPHCPLFPLAIILWCSYYNNVCHKIEFKFKKINLYQYAKTFVLCLMLSSILPEPCLFIDREAGEIIRLVASVKLSLQQSICLGLWELHCAAQYNPYRKHYDYQSVCLSIISSVTSISRFLSPHVNEFEEGGYWITLRLFRQKPFK